jgi:hypothetical protein
MIITEIKIEIFDGHFLLAGQTFLTRWLELHLHPILTTVNSILTRRGAYSIAGLHNPEDTSPR